MKMLFKMAPGRIIRDISNDPSHLALSLLFHGCHFFEIRIRETVFLFIDSTMVCTKRENFEFEVHYITGK